MYFSEKNGGVILVLWAQICSNKSTLNDVYISSLIVKKFH